MVLKKVTTEITYKVPAWGFCNIQGNVLGQPSKEKCRFCVKEKGSYRCALYNEVLDTNGSLIKKARSCEKAVAGFRSIVTDVEPSIESTVDPKLIVKTTLKEYIKVRKQLVSQGYPDTVAEQAAYEYIMGGN